MTAQMTLLFIWVVKGSLLVLGWVILCGIYIEAQDYKDLKVERSYWLRAKFWTQGVDTRVRVQGMEVWTGADVSSFSRQISTIFIPKTLLLVQEIDSQAWVRCWTMSGEHSLSRS